MKRIIAMEPAVNQLFHDFIFQAAPWLKKIRYNKLGIWSANPVIEKQIDKILSEFATKYKQVLKVYMTTAWELSEEKNDSIFMKLLKAAGIAVGAKKLLKLFNRERPSPGGDPVDLSNILTLPRRVAARDAFLKNRLDQVISARVWNLVGQNKTLILNCVQSGILEGKSAPSIARELKKYLKNPDKLFRRVRNPKTGKLGPSKAAKAYHPGRGVYRSSYQNALRLARNETNMSYRKADIDRWQKDPSILGYEVKLSGSHIVTDMCDELTGRYPKSFVWLTWHPSCFCYAVPILPNPDQFADHLLNDTPVTGHTTTIPKQATSYVKKNSEKILAMPAKKRPYFIRDNFKIDKNKKKIKLNIKTP